MTFKDKLQTILTTRPYAFEPELGRLREALDAGRLMALYGCGANGIWWLERFQSRGGVELRCVVDRNKGDQADSCGGVPLINYREFLERDDSGELLVLVTPHELVTEGKAKDRFMRECREHGYKDFCLLPMAWLVGDDLEYHIDAQRCLDNLDRLGDNLSKHTYVDHIGTILNRQPLHIPWNGWADQYIANDLFELTEDDCVVDCGAYHGDTLQKFAGIYSRLREYIAFEPTPETFGQMRQAAESCPFPVRPVNKAVGSKPGTLRFFLGLPGSGSNYITDFDEGHAIEIPVCTLDDELSNDRPTFIKMDVEGFELEALRGAEGVIKKHRPILAICIYHKTEDLYVIPDYIRELCPDYHMYVRKYGNTEWELVLYAIPPERLMK